MLTFRNTSIFFAALFFGLIGVQFGLGVKIPVFVYLLGALGYVSLLAWGSSLVHSQFYLKVICKAETKEKVVAISFDDGPVDRYTPKFLDLLKKFKVKAAFFCVGHRVEKRKGLIRRLHREGHLIGNHTYSHHFWFDFFPFKKMSAELAKTGEAVRKIIGLRPLCFRPPYGVTTPDLAKAVRRANLIPIGWNIRSLDTVIQDSKKIVWRALDPLRPGSIMLFHDTSAATLAALPEIFLSLRKKGYRIVRLDKMLRVKAYEGR